MWVCSICDREFKRKGSHSLKHDPKAREVFVQKQRESPRLVNLAKLSRGERQTKYGHERGGRGRPKGFYHSGATKKQIGESNLGKTRSDVVKQRNRELHLGKTPSEATKKQMSESRTRAIIEGRVKPSYNHFPIETLKGGYCYFRSTWEVNFAKILDDDPDVIEFMYEAIRVPYVFEGCERNTVPNFLIKMKDRVARVVEVARPDLVEFDPQRIAKMTVTKEFVEREGFEYLWFDDERVREFCPHQLSKVT